MIIEGDRIKKTHHRPRHTKRPGMKVSNRKFTTKNKRESDSMILYNDDYKDYLPKKRTTISSKSKVSRSRRSGKALKHEGRISSRKPQKSHHASKGTHKRSQSLNKSNTDQRYKSVPQNGYHHEHENKTKKNFIKAKFNTIVNNRTPQIHHMKGKYKDVKLELSLRNAKRNLYNYFRESKQFENYNKNNFSSLTGREKSKAF